MKRIRALLIIGIIFICLFCLLSCSNGSSGSADTTSFYEFLSQTHGIPLEPKKKDLPSYADLCKIEREMTKDEVTNLVGNPQRIEKMLMSTRPEVSAAHEAYCYIYDSSDGYSLAVFFGWIGSESSELVVLNTTPISRD